MEIQFITQILSSISPHQWLYAGIGIFILALSWIAGKLLQINLLQMRFPQGYSNFFVVILASLVKALCICFGLLVLVGTLGIDVGSIIQGFMFLGFGVSFILKDLISDVVAGFFIAMYKPFRMGQELAVTLESKATYQGKVVAIDIRYTTLENDQQTILVPNSYMFKQPLCLTKAK
jgi:small conductance mechanosensitive channel